MSDRERERFEAWAKKQDFIKDVQRYPHKEYGHWDTEKAWRAWQAAAATSKQAEIDQINNAIADHVTVRGGYKQRIDQLESAIREYLAKIDKPYRVCHDEKLPLETLRNLVSESK